MKRCGLLLTTLASVALTVAVLHKSGWVARPAQAASADDNTTRAGWQYFHSGPRHWRSYVLHP